MFLGFRVLGFTPFNPDILAGRAGGVEESEQQSSLEATPLGGWWGGGEGFRGSGFRVEGLSKYDGQGFGSRVQCLSAAVGVGIL